MAHWLVFDYAPPTSPSRSDFGYTHSVHLTPWLRSDSLKIKEQDGNIGLEELGKLENTLDFVRYVFRNEEYLRLSSA